jgi:hypothetical protein
MSYHSEGPLYLANLALKRREGNTFASQCIERAVAIFIFSPGRIFARRYFVRKMKEN